VDAVAVHAARVKEGGRGHPVLTRPVQSRASCTAKSSGGPPFRNWRRRPSFPGLSSPPKGLKSSISPWPPRKVRAAPGRKTHWRTSYGESRTLRWRGTRRASKLIFSLAHSTGS